MRVLATSLCLSLALVAAGCGGDDAPQTPTEPAPVPITETFTGTLNVNGLRSHSFTVTRAGTVSAQLAALSEATATLALSLGTWNGVACQIVIANPAATVNITVTGTAQSIGQFCVLLQDAGKLTASVDYTVNVSYY